MTGLIGVVLGLVSALGVTVGQILGKRLASTDVFAVSMMRFAPSVPFLALLVTIFEGWHTVPLVYILALLSIVAPLEVALSNLLMRSVALAPLSMTAPLGAFSSIFLIPLGFFVFGDVPTWMGILGVGLIVLGSFFVSVRETSDRLFDLKVLITNQGCRYALYAALVSSVVTVINKYLFVYVSPLESAFYTTLVMTAYLGLYLGIRGRLTSRSGGIGQLSALGVTQAAVTAATFVGLGYLPAAYFMSLKRTNIIFGVIAGWVWFGEKRALMRFFGAFLMLCGVLGVLFASL